MTLKHRVALRVPSTYKTDKRISKQAYEQRVHSVAVTFAELYGGFETSEVSGGWLSPDAKLVTETIKLVQSFADKVDEPSLLEQAKAWCSEWEQEAVLIEIDGVAHFVGVV